MPGDSVVFEVKGETSLIMGGFSLYLESSALDGTTSITAQSLYLGNFSYVLFPPVLPQMISNTTISTGFDAFSNSPLPADVEYLLVTITVTFDINATLGQYTIGNTGSTVFTDSSFSQTDLAPASGFSVTVVPEPSTGMLLLAGTGLLAVGLRRRRIAHC